MQASKSLINITSRSQFDSEVLKSSEPVIVDFYADWCGPCKKLAPILEKALEENKSFRLAKVNVDVGDNKDLSDEYNVSGIPHLVLIHEGKNVMEFSGFDPNSLNKMIEKTKELTKKKPFSGTGVVLDSNSQGFQDEGLPDELFNELASSIPSEPEASDSSSYNIIVKCNEKNLQRRFRADDLINHVKLFVKSQVKTLREVELFEPFPRKVFNNDESSIKDSGLSKNQILLARII